MVKHNSRTPSGQGTIRRLIADDEGMLTVMQLVTVTFMAVAALFVMNAIRALHDKAELQAAADASARAAATWLARGMNALSTTNHLIGEAMGMLAVHEAIAGPNPGRQIGDTSRPDALLTDAYEDLRRVIASPPDDLEPEQATAWRTAAESAAPFAYDEVGQAVRAGATVLKAKRILKLLLEEVYRAKAADIRRGDFAAARARNPREQQILDEYELLTGLRERAADDRVMEAGRSLKRDVLPGLRDYADLVVGEIPRLAAEASEKIALANGAQVQLYPAELRLPVERDPLATANDLSPIPEEFYGERKPTAMFDRPEGVADVGITRRQIVKITQLSRASFPWVNYHREPILRFLRNNCPLSDAGKIYFDETAGKTIALCDRWQREERMGLYVLRYSTPPDKGYENWTDDPWHAASLFSVVAIAHPLTQASEQADKQSSESAADTAPDPHPAATARAMIYNGRSQQPHEKRIDLRTQRIVPIRQAYVGWDTLQWQANEDDKMPFELIGKGSLLTPEFPRVQVTWHARLVPMQVEEERTRFREIHETTLNTELGEPPEELDFIQRFPVLSTH